eukprot:m.133553 g.133553  ORF g.133553 m.133553 type:complete len:71 (+) comp13101_c0_seq17:326-538(+)
MFEPTEKAIFVITPTYERRTQLLDLTRVAQALQIASAKHNILWVIVEDSPVKTELGKVVYLVLTHFHNNI